MLPPSSRHLQSLCRSIPWRWPNSNQTYANTAHFMNRCNCVFILCQVRWSPLRTLPLNLPAMFLHANCEQACQLSLILRETLTYWAFLPLSRMRYQFFHIENKKSFKWKKKAHLSSMFSSWDTCSQSLGTISSKMYMLQHKIALKIVYRETEMLKCLVLIIFLWHIWWKIVKYVVNFLESWS